MREAAALMLGGAFVGGGVGARWLEQGEHLLRREIKHQVLADGVHYERSPMYHAAVLWDLIIVGAVLLGRTGEIPAWCRTVINQLAEVLHLLCRPDGTYAHFNDSGEGVVERMSRIMAGAAALSGSRPSSEDEGVRFLREAGYLVWWNEKTGGHLIADLNAVTARGCPGHLHDDALSFEFSIGSVPWIVNAGVHGYGADPFREYSRSARSHSTVELCEPQSERWGAFRVGGLVKAAPPIVELGNDWTAAGMYSPWRSPATLHRRTFAMTGGGSSAPILRVADEVTGAACTVRSYLHFPPEVDVHALPSGLMLRRSESELELIIEFAGYRLERLVRGDRETGLGCYFPAYGEVRTGTSAVLVLTKGVSGMKKGGFTVEVA